jgi:hypothetical protein
VRARPAERAIEWEACPRSGASCAPVSAGRGRAWDAMFALHVYRRGREMEGEGAWEPSAVNDACDMCTYDGWVCGPDDA